MNRLIRVFGFVLVASALATLPAMASGEQQPPQTPKRPMPPVEDLGDNRYRIGRIVLDKAKRQFSVPGRILHLAQTLEYLAVARDGRKGYESLLELDTSGLEFQLACILVGLDDAGSVKPRYQFDEREARGQSVDVSVSWQHDGRTREIDAAAALLAGGEPFDDHDWVYIGSVTQGNGDFMAQTIGTLIGFVHDPFAVIEHRRGAGIGAYGLVTGNDRLLPPEGAPVTVSITVKDQEVGERTGQQP